MPKCIRAPDVTQAWLPRYNRAFRLGLDSGRARVVVSRVPFMPLSAGDKLGHFEVVGAIGQGGMGEVYKARDTRLDRTVAIKVLHRLVSSDPAFRERFECEARAVSSLNHPHICTLHDVGSEGGQRDPGGLCAHLVYTQSGGLWAVAFDLETLESTSSPTIVLEDIYSSDRIDYVAISQVGTLVYAAGETKVGGGLTLAWVDREGRVTPVAAEPTAYNAPRLSPDGSQLAVSISDLGEEEAWISTSCAGPGRASEEVRQRGPPTAVASRIRPTQACIRVERTEVARQSSFFPCAREVNGRRLGRRTAGASCFTRCIPRRDATSGCFLSTVIAFPTVQGLCRRLRAGWPRYQCAGRCPSARRILSSTPPLVFPPTSFPQRWPS